ncbi:hypothetical protein CgunFtcFv8_005888 [Champsocephalus gunnari]|uniref:Receptor ligand binding region domain-containing protein n=1 Tax=Champsocephalus gunnari TaxID=52237 RepID=A0AAN8CZJ2_CHAGU|nr:hypothetical protein CgunFtcFv8_005888 [Champsocephalus gunnari]
MKSLRLLPMRLLPLLLLQSAACSGSAGNSSSLQVVTLAAILPLTNTEYAWAWPRVAPALHLAVRQVNSDPELLSSLVLRLVHRSSENRAGFCSDSMAPLMAVDLKQAFDPWAFIGPGCDYSSSPVARFTTHWGVPMVTAGARAAGFSVYGAVTNTGPTHQKLGEMGEVLMEAFGWRHRAMLVYTDNKDANNDRPCYFAAEGLYLRLGRQNLTVREHVMELEHLRASVREIRDHGRVVFVCCSWDILRSLLVQFLKDGAELEDFVFFFLDLFAEGLEGPGPVRPWFRGDEDDQAAKLAFRSVKVLSYMQPQNPEYLEFVETLKTDAKEMFNFTINDSLYNIIAAGFYDGVKMYAQALNETLSEQRPEPGPGPGRVQRPRGDLVTRRMWNRTFPAVTGLLQMDESGDRQMDFSVWDTVDLETGEFGVVCVYKGSTKQLIMQEGRSFQWPGGSPPADFPECGFKNNKPSCLARTVTMHQMVAIVICFVFVIIVTVTVFIYRKLKLESELAAQLWRVSWDDVQMSNLDKVLRRACSRLTMSLKGSNCGSLLTMEGNFQIYTKTGYY